MQTHKNKLIAILFIAIFATSIALSTAPNAQAHTPPWNIPTFAYISANPNPVGLGQEVLLVVWINQVIAGVDADNDIRFKDYKLTITKPDSTTETVTWNVVSDPTSAAYTQYVPNQVGTYTLFFEFPGQTYTWSGAYQGDYYLPSNATTTFTVQEDPISHQPIIPLPTEYWTRPIEGQNILWEQISSNWLSGSATADRWQEYGSAPTSSHIMWSKIFELGGLAGESAEVGATYYSGFSYETRFNNPIIISGILCYPISLGHASTGGGYVAVDLRTGEELWRRDDISPTFAQLYDYASPNQHGIVGGILWQASSSTWMAYDPLSGKGMFNLTGVPSGTEVYTDKGEIVRYVMNYPNRWIALWNWTAATGTRLGTSGTSEDQWRVNGKSINTTTAYSWNVTIPNLPGETSPSIIGVIPGDVIIGRSSNIALTSLSRGTSNPWTMWALSDKPESRGQLLWIKNYTAPAGDITRMLAWQPIDPVTRTIAMTDFETGQRLGYSIDTGDLKWGPVGEFRAFNYYSSRAGFPAYGNLYVSGYGGELQSFSMKNGSLLWKFNDTNSGIETPWGLYPIQTAAIADDIVFSYAGEHSPNTPLYKGYRVYANNATTGELLWNLLAWSASGLGTSLAPVAIADGYLVHLNAYDGKVYCVGKGPSALTVDAPMAALSSGQSVVIRGSITDISAGTKQAEQAARFPNGVPVVSDESMTAWMEYVYMQKPCPTNVTGVPISIDVIDSNGNYRNIGIATSDGSGAYSLMWTPDISGKYTVIASFAGSESYYGAYAQTALAVDEAPPTTPAPTPAPATMAEQYFLPMTTAILVAIAILAVLVVYSIFKKR
ncbi:MAG: PQQ-binding-like beta-propeller repeat protein [Candidatus Bathyarchaeota archaeon]|nr:PQQ-binding-like beta-propeller repeat protein [Candidatus Bathyarchaeota archaeon]